MSFTLLFFHSKAGNLTLDKNKMTESSRQRRELFCLIHPKVVPAPTMRIRFREYSRLYL